MRLSKDEIEAILLDCQPKVLIAEPDWLTWGPHTIARIALDTPEQASAGTPFTRLRAAQPATPAALDDTAPLCLIYTAATEGVPKGAVITHGNLHASVTQLIESWDLKETDAALGALPLYHVAGLTLYAALLACGGATRLMPRFDAALTAQHIHHGRVNVMGSFSPMLEQVLDSAAQQGLNLAPLRLVYGLEPPAILERLARAAPDVVFQVSYGQTETCGLVATAPLHECPGSAGRAMPLTEIRVVDELGADRPVGEIGLITVQGPSVSPGYWNQSPQDTPIRLSGWHDTGDLGLLDAQGTLFFRGPAPRKRLIKSGGENVYPAEVEQALRSHPAVADAMVLGLPDPEWGEIVAALCVCAPGSTVEPDALGKYVAQRIARYKRPRRIRFIEQMPRTAQGQADLDAARHILLDDSRP